MTLVGVAGGVARVLPWLLDPHLPWRVVAPFARGLVSVALESALVVGWPVGWALAVYRFVENGEAGARESPSATPGISPAEVVLRLVPQGAALAVALAMAALVAGTDSSAPGRVATELVAGAQASCAAARTPTTYVVPFTDLTWLCAPDREPRVAGKVPGTGGRMAMTAKAARIAGDFRAIDLDDVRLAVPGDPPASVQVQALSMHGMAPWAHGSTLPAPLRALCLTLSAWSSAAMAAYWVLRRAASARTGAILLGSAGPLAALGLMRLLERADARPAVFALLPLAASAAALSLGALLPRLRRAASKLRQSWELASRMPRC
jgi:hypothetical protein